MQVIETKYIISGDSLVEKRHWIHCEKNRFPYIVVTNTGWASRIFFDSTNILNQEELDTLKSTISDIHKSYSLFFGLNNIEFPRNLEAYSITVKKEHLQVIAERLFEYILELKK